MVSVGCTAAHHDNVAMFGFFEADDGDAARALLGAVEAWARARGRTVLPTAEQASPRVRG